MKVAFDERISLCLLTEIPGQAGDDILVVGPRSSRGLHIGCGYPIEPGMTYVPGMTMLFSDAECKNCKYKWLIISVNAFLFGTAHKSNATRNRGTRKKHHVDND